MTTTFPVFTDQVGGTPGSNLNAADLNTFVQAITYRLSGGIASSASGLTVTQPACQAVINSGAAAPLYLNVVATTVPLNAGPGTSQDQYVYLLNTGLYQVVSVNHGGTPTPPVTANIPLYYATTNAGNTAVSSYTDVSNTNPLPASSGFMNLTGSNAGAVAFPSTLAVTGATTLNGLTNNGASTLTGLATLNGGATMGGDIAMANKLLKNAGSVGVGTSSPVSSLHVAVAPAANAAFGVVNLGSGPFDGSSGNHFVGSGSGTLLAGNTAAGFGGNLIDMQVGGVSKLSLGGAGVLSVVTISASGNVNATGGVTAGASSSVAGNFTIASGHLLATGAAPTFLALSGMGSGASASGSVGNDMRGTISIVTGSGLIPGFLQVCRVTFAVPYGAAPFVQVMWSVAISGVPGTLFVVNKSTTQFELWGYWGTTVPAGTINFDYTVTG